MAFPLTKAEKILDRENLSREHAERSVVFSAAKPTRGFRDNRLRVQKKEEKKKTKLADTKCVKLCDSVSRLQQRRHRLKLLARHAEIHLFLGSNADTHGVAVAVA